MNLEEKIRWRRYRKPSMFEFKNGFEVRFGDGIPESDERKNSGATFIYPEEIIGKTCGGCVRYTSNNDGFGRKGISPEGYHCSMRGWDIPIRAEDKACVSHWDRAEYERAEQKHEDDIQKRREELWAVYAEKEPVKLPIVNDGYGNIPQCPVCGEMPYDLEQCYWCGQRFIQDEDLEEYATPIEKDYTCSNCGKVGKAIISKYNGHKHFRCEDCGFSFME